MRREHAQHVRAARKRTTARNPKSARALPARVHREAAYLSPGSDPDRGLTPETHSHSMVAGGFELRSSATRFTPGISLMILLEIVSRRSYGKRAQPAVIASSAVTARMTIGYAYVRSSPCTPTERAAGRPAHHRPRPGERPARPRA